MTGIYNNKYDILASTIKPNPNSVKYWADLSSNPNGGDLKYFDGKDWVYVNNKATGDISQLQADLTAEINRAKATEATKVDKVEGKGLSTNDYTTAEKEKLASLTNYDDTTINGKITTIESSLANKVDKDGAKVLSDNNYTTEEKNKLAGLSNFDDTELSEALSALTLKVETLETNYAALEARVAALEGTAA